MIFGAIVGGLVLYFLMPPLIPIVIVALFFVMLLYNSVIRALLKDMDYGAKFDSGTSLAFLASIVVIIVLVAGAICTPALYAKELHRIPDVTVMNGSANVISIDHIRTVPYATALWKADKKVGELGYKLEVESPHIQFRDGELKWLVPLEYNGLYKFISSF